MPAVKDLVWLQEEPKNCGAYWFIQNQLKQLGKEVRYIGRTESASPATGSPKAHHRQQQTILEAAFDFEPEHPGAIDIQ